MQFIQLSSTETILHQVDVRSAFLSFSLLLRGRLSLRPPYHRRINRYFTLCRLGVYPSFSCRFLHDGALEHADYPIHLQPDASLASNGPGAPYLPYLHTKCAIPLVLCLPRLHYNCKQNMSSRLVSTHPTLYFVSSTPLLNIFDLHMRSLLNAFQE